MAKTEQATKSIQELRHRNADKSFPGWRRRRDNEIGAIRVGIVELGRDIGRAIGDQHRNVAAHCFDRGVFETDVGKVH